MKIFILTLIVFLIYGCGESVSEKEGREYNQWKEKQQIEACIKAGGIPMFSSWNGMMRDCKFPKEKDD